MQSFVEGVVYFYIFVCFALMVFNILYILRSSWAERRREVRARYWKSEIDKAEGPFVLNERQVRKLANVQQFASFHRAITYWVLGTNGSDEFFCNNAHQIQQLALVYARREAMERAFMASFIASFRCRSSANAAMLAEIMLGYLENSTIFCRENVLQALYALGRPHAVENALNVMNDRGWYHNPKLLSDGMTMFTGNKEELVLSLWQNHAKWDEPFNVAVVQFAAFLESEAIAEQFERELVGGEVTVEVRFALIRYFGRHPNNEVLPTLLRYVEEDGQFAVPAAAVLSAYNTAQSKDALVGALSSPNWHVRHNAALSLGRLGVSANERRAIEAIGDRYAIEMLDYVLGPDETNGQGGPSSGSSPAVPKEMDELYDLGGASSPAVLDETGKLYDLDSPDGDGYPNGQGAEGGAA